MLPCRAGAGRMDPNPTTSRRFPRRLWPLLLLLPALAGCNLVAGLPQDLLVQDVPVPTPAPPQPDANEVMAGICFASANDAAGQVFVLRSADELARLFDLADNSRLCRQPVTRGNFDFGDGRILAGLWSAGRGCNAQHEVVHWRRDEAARRFTLQLRLRVTGDCDYELLQPWWMALENAAGFEVDIQLLP